jgi:uncharacterized protein DUF4260
MFAKPSILLRIEGGAIFAASVFGYYQNHASWMCFVLLFLTPDLFMLSYLANMRVGAMVYNIAHTLLMPGLLFTIGIFIGKPLVAFVLIWTAHIGFDRLLGFGLKYPTRFKDTHLQHV